MPRWAASIVMPALLRKRRRVRGSGCNREMVVFTLVSILKGVTALRATSERRGSGEWNSCDSVSLSPVGLTGGVGWRQLTVAYLLSPEWRDRVHTACAVYWRVAARR